MENKTLAELEAMRAEGRAIRREQERRARERQRERDIARAVEHDRAGWLAMDAQRE